MTVPQICERPKIVETKNVVASSETYVAFELLSVWIVSFSMSLKICVPSEQKSAVAGENFSFKVSLQEMPAEKEMFWVKRKSEKFSCTHCVRSDLP